MNTKIPLNKLLGENVSYVYACENVHDGQVLSLFGKVVDVKPENENAGVDAKIVFEVNEVRSCIELSWDAVTYGELSLIRDGQTIPLEVTDTDVGLPSYPNGTATVEFLFSVDDADTIKESFGNRLKTLKGEDLADSMLAPFSFDPFGVGTPKIELHIGNDIVVATLTAEITDAALLHHKVSQAGRLAGRDNDWEPDCAAEALYEAFLGANDASSILDYGFELSFARTPEGKLVGA